MTCLDLEQGLFASNIEVDLRLLVKPGFPGHPDFQLNPKFRMLWWFPEMFILLDLMQIVYVFK
jgi:hypothetical protein